MTDRQPVEPQYEPPTITSLGSVEAVTAGAFDSSAQDGTTTLESDKVLKHDIEAVEDALSLLRRIGTRS